MLAVIRSLSTLAGASAASHKHLSSLGLYAVTALHPVPAGRPSQKIIFGPTGMPPTFHRGSVLDEPDRDCGRTSL